MRMGSGMRLFAISLLIAASFSSAIPKPDEHKSRVIEKVSL